MQYGWKMEYIFTNVCNAQYAMLIQSNVNRVYEERILHSWKRCFWIQ